MAIKRRAVSEADTEIEGPQASKRVRTGDDNDVEVNDAPEASGSRSAAVELDEDDADIQQVAPDADEEKRFEQEHEDAIREQVFNKGNKGQGNIAEMGIIEKLEMHNFMCHKYLVFHFGPQINFIIGHNGSGKSAVLTALTIALGGKATITGRGSGLKSFIKEGEDISEITVTLKNQGEDAYKPKVYGESILIRRQFSKTGSSSYKIMAKNMKVISTKREELSNICDHLNIQVDNPMNILTQDSARQFLSASQPADKYKFFLKGTQLSQLSEEYSTCMENIVQTQKVLKNKSEVIPDLEEALRDATQRFKEADKARQQKHKADELKKELAWAHVAAKQEEYEEKLREVEKQKKRVKKVKSSLEEAEIKKTDAEQAVIDLEQQIEQLGTFEHLDQRKKTLTDEIKKINVQLNTLSSEERKMNDEVNSKDKLIKDLKRHMAEEDERMKNASQGQVDEASRKLAETEELITQAKAERDELKEDILRKGREQAERRSEGTAIEAQISNVQSQIDAATSQLRLIDDRERTKLAPFGMNLDKVLAQIPQMRWHGQKPVGPLGQFVKARDMKWAPLLRARLGGAMGMFAITDARDRAQLDALLKQHGNGRPNIVISEVDLFDYSRGEPPAEYTTLLRILNISDEYVLRILINSYSIESILVAETRADADRQLQRLGRGIAWTMDFYTVQRFPEGGGQSSLATQLRPNDPRQQTFTSDDLSTQRQRFQEQLREAEANYNQLRTRLAEVQSIYRTEKKSADALAARSTELERRFKALERTRDALQEELNQDLPMSLQTLQEELKEQEESKEATVAQFRELQDKINRVQKTLEPLQEELRQVRNQILNHNSQRGGIEKLVEDAAVQRLAAQNSVGHWEKKLAEENAKVGTLQEVADQLEQEFTVWTSKAKEYCEEWPEPRKVAEVQRNLDAIQRALQTRERQQGATVDQMTLEVNKRKAALDDAKKDLKLMMQLNKSLRKSIRVRLNRWHEFRRHIALRCKIYFQYHLSNRGYFGKVLFDHIHGTLQLKVQTDDQLATQAGSREKDPNALSGGEKSFSTICLLLSLWESIGCPIRCLDEFDVFMDAVNRRISMKMMIDTANASDRKQYILITPQDMNNVHIGATVRVHRMTDPERGQNTLAFN